MKRSTRAKINLVIVIALIAAILLAAVGIALDIYGIRYIVGDNGTKFFGKTVNGIVLKGTLRLPDGSGAKIDRTLGTIIYDNGDIYDGDFSGFYRNGNGKMTYALSGDSYEGGFADDVISGNGIYTCADGSRYEGEFSDGKMNGHGVYTWSDGSTYDGEFADNLKNGSGSYVGSDGSSYVGEYKNDKKDGYGTYRYSNGDSYIGEFANDVRSGNGTYTWANGEYYVGEFSNNLKHGKGTYTWPAPNSRSYDGYFENGAVVIVEETPTTDEGVKDNISEENA